MPNQASAKAMTPAVISLLLSLLLGLRRALPRTLGIRFRSCLIALTAWTLVQKYGEPHAA